MVPKNLKDVFYRQVDLVTTKPLTMENVLVAYTQHLAALPSTVSQYHPQLSTALPPIHLKNVISGTPSRLLEGCTIVILLKADPIFSITMLFTIPRGSVSI
jgi:hypothetical protein